MTRIENILVEHYQIRDTIGIGIVRPRLSWRVIEASHNWIQEQFEILVTDELKRPIYRGRTETSQSTLVEWPCRSLESREIVEVSVRVKGISDDSWSRWSQPIVIETALIQKTDIEAKFISSSDPKQTQTREVLFRKEFVCSNKIAKARLYSTARGVYEIEINGKNVGKDILSPGWTSYLYRIVQRTDKVDTLINPGTNTIGIRLADGWFSGAIGMNDDVNIWGDTNMAWAQLELTYDDGTISKVCTDDSWIWTTGPIIAASIYNGETYDATQEVDHWSSSDLTDLKSWRQVLTHDVDVPIEPPLGPPIRCTQVLKPIKVFKSKSGKDIVDFGQNFAGVVRLKGLKGPRNHKITIHHAEVMENEELGIRPLRSALNRDEYILKGDPHGENWTPRFTYHGFRYIQVDGYPQTLDLNSIEGVVFHSDFEIAGSFECSDERLNALHRNVCWSMRSNFMSVPTDCPQRNERLGWTGDISLFGSTANYLYRCQGFLESWLRDLAIEQEKYKLPQLTCPTPFWKYENLWKDTIAAAWQDATITVPWQIYLETGDVSVLEIQYRSMTDWLDKIPRDEEGLFWSPESFQFGDWLDPDAPPDNPFKAKTDPQYVANACLIRSTEIVAEVAELLRKSDDESKYKTQTMALKNKFNVEYLTESGQTTNYSQTSYALAIVYGLFNDIEGNCIDRLTTAGKILAKIVEDNKYCIGTGFIGTPIICDALTLTGRLDIAYKMLLNDKYPSWLYPLTMGATTTWERWDSMLPDGRINPGEMTSFNHYALGAISDWMYRTIGGLSSMSPGWQHILIKPRPGGDITHAKVEHVSLFGKASCSWTIVDDHIEVQVSIPANCKASIELLDGNHHAVGSGNYTFDSKIDL